MPPATTHPSRSSVGPPTTLPADPSPLPPSPLIDPPPASTAPPAAAHAAAADHPSPPSGWQPIEDSHRMSSEFQKRSEGTLHSENVPDAGVLTPLSPNIILFKSSVKKQPRQWAAWTRQEEERFFHALRLVGKDFDKITRRVQTKNKDQVRHYYYRLIRRMNKILAPGSRLNAQNSKDTIAAMLRWWSLLEKHSCTASKLHLKPRRFKIFLEALEHQLSKDRRRSKKKRPSQGDERSLLSVATTFSLLSKSQGNDMQPTKLLFVDGQSQSMQKSLAAKGAPSLKRSINICCTDRDMLNVKIVRQRRKTGTASSASYRRWEKAAIAGVNLVADAAEHLEGKTSSDKNGVAGASDVLNNGSVSKLQQRDILPPSITESVCIQHKSALMTMPSSMKLKLQLFPVDEDTRKALEKVEHNPHLELTLSTRKKMSSVLDHLKRKWETSTIDVSGELALLPYTIHLEALSTCQKWTSDTLSTAADVYASIGCPSVFRLRYGWFPTLVSSMPLSPSSSSPLSQGLQQRNSVHETNAKDKTSEIPSTGDLYVELAESQKYHIVPEASEMDLYLSNNTSGDHDTNCEVQSMTGTRNMLLLREDNSSPRMAEQCEDMVQENIVTGCDVLFSAGDWADTLTNISISDIFSEASRAAEAGCGKLQTASSQSLFNFDSFDATIASHLRHTSVSATRHSPIWDAEETCDEFLFQKAHATADDVSAMLGINVSDLSSATHQTDLNDYLHKVEEVAETDQFADPSKTNAVDVTVSDGQREDIIQKNQIISELYWPDSLGPLDLEVSSFRYHEPFLADSASLGGLSRLIASSLDAFQNFSFF